MEVELILANRKYELNPYQVSFVAKNNFKNNLKISSICNGIRSSTVVSVSLKKNFNNLCRKIIINNYLFYEIITN